MQLLYAGQGDKDPYTVVQTNKAPHSVGMYNRLDVILITCIYILHTVP